MNNIINERNYDDEFANLMNALAESVFDMSDEEVGEEIADEGWQPEATRNLLLNAVRECKNKRRINTMREISSHLQSGFTKANNKIFAIDEPGTGGASHKYVIQSADGKEVATIDFQHGPVSGVGVNGLVDDALLIILLDRMNAFNQGDFRCRENSLVITKLEEALLG